MTTILLKIKIKLLSKWKIKKTIIFKQTKNEKVILNQISRSSFIRTMKRENFSKKDILAAFIFFKYFYLINFIKV